MDSGNSASLQSSSTGDEEYDSRPDSIMAAFLANQQPPHGASFAAPVFDHNFSTFLSNQNPLLNFDMPWTRTDRSDPIPPDLAAPPSNSAANHNLSPISNFSDQVQNFPHHPSEGATSSFPPTDQTELQNIPNNCGGGGGGGLHPKKRPRASRRAPTTVLTTNTTNFRAMVQEFTGIPAPPFTASSSSSPFTRNAARFDLFGSGRKATHLDVAPSTQTQTHLLRPFPQKPSPSTTALLAAANLQNPIFNVNSMFQSTPRFNPCSLNDQSFKMATFEEFGLGSLPPPNHAPACWGAGAGELNHPCVNLRSGHGNVNGKFIRCATGTANSSAFFGNKAVEDLRVREGMVEPWICSSD